VPVRTISTSGISEPRVPPESGARVGTGTPVRVIPYRGARDVLVSPLAGKPIKPADADRLAGVLKAVTDPAWLRLVSLIQSAPDNEAAVTELTAPLGLSQATVSHHHRILTRPACSNATSTPSGRSTDWRSPVRG